VKLLAIDPGPTESAFVLYDAERRVPTWWEKAPNDALLGVINPKVEADYLAVEMVASYGMAVGAEVFDTCVWVGRFIQAWVNAHPGAKGRLVYRREVKLHLCADSRAKDANIRQALIDRYGPGKERAVGLKASPGPLYGMTGDCWAALGVAITAAETRSA
jgi:hypothetical protein